MYVKGYVDHPNSDEDSGYCWCKQTQHTIGSDDKIVIRLDCTAARQCFQETRESRRGEHAASPILVQGLRGRLVFCRGWSSETLIIFWKILDPAG